MIPPIQIEKFTYELPHAKIARFPIEPRSRAKLLHYKGGQVSHFSVNDLPKLLPKGSLLVFNNTKVIPARLFFRKPTGAQIELFLLHPILPSTHLSRIMHTTDQWVWMCTIGNLKRWRKDLPLSLALPQKKGFLRADLLDKTAQKVRLQCTNPSLTLSEVLLLAGQTPLPPYLNRKPVDADRRHYQTIYGTQEGAVAAPTAGLHFTQDLLAEIKSQNIDTEEVTLHTSAATFRPIKTQNLSAHPMHSEQIVIGKQTIMRLLSAEKLINVGTTTLRTLESIYWYGVKILTQAKTQTEVIPFRIEKLFPYEFRGDLPTRRAALEAVKQQFGCHKTTQITGETSIFIFPGYQFQMCDGLLTNFHQPKSTLLLLVAALVGSGWENIYQQALQNNYRFLSYGDGSLLFPEYPPKNKNTMPNTM